MAKAWPLRSARVSIVIAMAAAVTLLRASPSLATTFDVTKTSDSGAGSFRNAITAANANPGLDTITFHIGSGAQTITPLSPLPAITDPVQIFGITQPGFSSAPLIEIKGTSAGPSANGLTIFTSATGTLVWGLAIDGFGGDGIEVFGAGGNGFQDDWLGINSGGGGTGNGGAGIHIVGSPNNTIDGRFCIFGCSTTFNEIVRNGSAGVKIEGSGATGNVVSRNFIGNVISVLPNTFGVWVTGNAAGNRIGGTSNDDRNWISGNFGPNVIFDSGATNNVLEGNSIGLVCLFTCVAAGGQGVVLQASNNTIGGATAGAGNVISGNVTDGVAIEGSANVVQGNLIGTNPDGTAALPNRGGDGIRILSGSGNTIGGTTAGAGNVISGNAQNSVKSIDTGNGIEVSDSATNNLVQGNLIGTNPAGSSGIGNANDGIRIDGAAGNTIGGTTASARNVISGNGTPGVSGNGNAGVELHVTGSPGNPIQGNSIGTNAAGTGTIPNQHGVLLTGVDSEIIGGTAPGAGNLISGNSLDGVELNGANSNDQVLGNLIGTDASGSSAVGNGTGVRFLGTSGNNSVGGASAGAGNVISGNGGNGIFFSTIGDEVLGNVIGTNSAGTAALGNGQNGILIQDASSNTIGGTTVGARNVISGNRFNGVELEFSISPTDNNVVEGNYIGTNKAGTAELHNGDPSLLTGDGVVVAADGNTIGGTSPGAGNLISGNLLEGVLLQGSSNKVTGNLIGTDFTGTSAVANGEDGIKVFGPTGAPATSNAIGGTAAGARNVISGNASDGVFIQGDAATSNVVSGNYIGTDLTGSLAVPNSGGVLLDASSNTVGGTAPGAGNLVSGNSGSGVLIFPFVSTTRSNNLVQGNLIGTKANGTQPLGNGLNGVLIFQATNNKVGGITAGARNVISANGRGVLISDATSTGNGVQGNFIGTDLNGSAAAGLGNAGPGIRVEQAPSTTIGGSVSGARNVISGNGGEGIDLEEAPSALVQGNLIGTDVTGTLGLGNAADGVLINGGSKDTIGGKGAARNVISGNRADGVHIFGSSAKANKVLGNLIGAKATGMAALATALDGVLLEGAPGNTIGGTSATLRNVISGNTANGVEITGSKATGNNVLGNFVGTKADGANPLPNGGHGVLITNSATSNKVGGTTTGAGDTIAFNGGAGVFVASGVRNAIHRNSIFSNTRLGIDLAPPGVNPIHPMCSGGGANNGQNYPVLTSASSSGGNTTIVFSFNCTPSVPNPPGFTIEFFSSPSCDPSGFGEGQKFLGSVSVATDASGNVIPNPFTATLNGVSVPPGSFVTATATDPKGNTSEFAKCKKST